MMGGETRGEYRSVGSVCPIQRDRGSIPGTVLWVKGFADMPFFLPIPLYTYSSFLLSPPPPLREPGIQSLQHTFHGCPERRLLRDEDIHALNHSLAHVDEERWEIGRRWRSGEDRCRLRWCRMFQWWRSWRWLRDSRRRPSRTTARRIRTRRRR